MLFIFLCVFTVILIGCHFSIQGTRKAKLINKIPGPAPLPIVGNAFDFICNPAELFYKARWMANNFRSHNIYKTWTISEPVINLYDPDDFEVVLSSFKHITKSKLYNFLHPWLNQGLLTSTGDKWHARRKILTPTFHFNILRQFCGTFKNESEKFVQQLKPVVDKEIDIMPFVVNFTLHTLCETAMGISLDSIQNNQSSSYQKAVKDMSKYFIHRLVRFWVHSPLLFAMSAIGKMQENTLSILHKFTNQVIDERRSMRVLTEGNFVVEDLDDEENIKKLKKRLAMLDLLLSAEADGRIDTTGIREEVDTFMFEGHDTTTMAITFCLMELANNRHIQDKVVEELKEIYRDDGEMTMEKLNKMDYLERCIKESLRLYPSVTMLGRYIGEEMQLKHFLIPPDTTCHLHIYDLHRRADIYPDPLKFDPERFTKENSLNRHPFAYVPFSAGPRNCIGQKFAMLELKAVISSIVFNYKLKAVTKPEDIILTADIILKSKDPIKIQFEHRLL